QFIAESRFERLGVFPYSHEEGTYASKRFKDDVPEVIKQSRADEIMELQQQISADLNSRKIGQVFKVLIDRMEGNRFVGRTEFDSPEVDGEVYVDDNEGLEVGNFYNVMVTGSEDYDLFGTVVSTP